MFQTVYEYIWWDNLWLPKELTWADLEDHDGLVYAKASDLYVSLPLAFLFLVIRLLFERYVATPFSRVLGVKERIKIKASPNPILERFYAASSKHPKQKDMDRLSKQTGSSVRTSGAMVSSQAESGPAKHP